MASFSQPLPSNYVVRLDLGVFNAGQVTMTPMPGSNGYTWFCYAFLPYSGMKSGYASVPLMVYDYSGKLVYSTTVQVQYTMF
ncbi:MAG: hypothetical protein ACP5G5_07735 [Thermoplasmata archaeon]